MSGRLGVFVARPPGTLVASWGWFAPRAERGVRSRRHDRSQLFLVRRDPRMVAQTTLAPEPEFGVRAAGRCREP